MNRLTITNNDKSVVLEDLDIKFPDDIKLGSYSVTVPSTPELSEVLTYGSLGATLDSLLGEGMVGSVIVTSKSADSISFNFIRTDYDGSIAGGGLSNFPDTKISKIGAFRVVDFVGDDQDRMTWKNIYGLKTTARKESKTIEFMEVDHTPVWDDMDPSTAFNPYGLSCKEDYSFRYSGGDEYIAGGQNRLMSAKLFKFTCLETGYYTFNINTQSNLEWHTPDFVGRDVILTRSNGMWVVPSLAFAIVEDDKYDDLRSDIIYYSDQDRYSAITPLREPQWGNANKYHNLVDARGDNAVSVYIKEGTVTTGIDTIGGNIADASGTIGKYTKAGQVIAKDGVVWSAIAFGTSLIEIDGISHHLLPFDIRGFIANKVIDGKMELLATTSWVNDKPTKSSESPYLFSSDDGYINAFVGQESVSLPKGAFAAGTLDADGTATLMGNRLTVDLRSTFFILPEIPLQAGKTYAFICQASSIPHIASSQGELKLRYTFPSKFSCSGVNIQMERSGRHYSEREWALPLLIQKADIFPSVSESANGEFTDHPAIDVIKASWLREGEYVNPDYPVVNTLALNPKGDYYDFARGLRGAVANENTPIREYNRLLLGAILSSDFKVTVSTSLNKFILPVREDTRYFDAKLSFDAGGSSVFNSYDGVDYTVLYEGTVGGVIESTKKFGIVGSDIVKSKMQFAIRDAAGDYIVDNAFEDTHTLSKDVDGIYHYDFLSLNHDTAKEINNYIEVTDFPCQFQVGGTWITTCSSNIVDVLNIDTIKETCTVRFYLPTAGYLL